MITENGVNGLGHTMWKLHVPDEHCSPGLEVGIEVGPGGIAIGGEVIKWDEIDAAKLRAKGYKVTPSAS